MHQKSETCLIWLAALLCAVALPMGCGSVYTKNADVAEPTPAEGAETVAVVEKEDEDESTADAPSPAPLIGPSEQLLLSAVEDTGRDIVWDSFESYSQWTVEAADDPAKLGINKDAKFVSAGRQSLRCEFTPFRKRRSHLRREVQLDLSQMSKMLFDVYTETEKLSISIAFRITAWQKFYQTYPIPLNKGWNKNLEVDLQGDQFNMAERGSPQLSTLDNRDDVRRISLVIHHEPESKGVVFFDNLRFRGWPEEDWEVRDPKIVSIDASSTIVRKFEKLELEVDFEGSYGSYFDPAEVDLIASFLSPDGQRITARGFLADYVDSTYEGSLVKWLVRFTPTEVGRWEYNVRVKTHQGETLSSTRVFHCREADGSAAPAVMPTSAAERVAGPGTSPNQRGFLRRSKIDGRYFEFDNGDFFYPIGQNVCWATDHEPYFKKMAAHGENFARIWMCPWHLPLELRDEVGKYNLESAKAMDRLVSLAEQYGIYLQIVIEYHGMVRDDSWGENPYNQANGGPCKRAQDFFVNGDARRLFKQRLRYLAARWGYSTHILAWELFNETDLTKHYDPSEVVRWHREMGGHLKSMDAQKHLVTTSCYNETFANELWKQWPIDFAQVHRYTPDVMSFVIQTATEKEDLNKPYFIGEFGRGWTADADQKDTEGAHLHAGLWGSFMTQAAGAAMVWWWDTYVDPQNLYRHHQALAAFAKGEDRRGKDYEPVRLTAQAPGYKKVDVSGLLSSTRCLLWLYRKDDPKTPAPPGVPRIPENTTLRLSGMWPGDYVIEFWDTYREAAPQRTETKCTDGSLAIVFPEAEKDIACKVIFQGSTSPEIKGVNDTE